MCVYFVYSGVCACVTCVYVCVFLCRVCVCVCMYVCFYVCTFVGLFFVCTERLKGMWSIIAKYNFAYHKNVFAVTLLVILKTNFWLYL